MEKLLSPRAERRRREAKRETFTTPKLVTTRRSILGPPAEGRPGPSDDDDDDDDNDAGYDDDDDDDVNITKTKKKEMRAQILALLLRLGYSKRYHHLQNIIQGDDDNDVSSNRYHHL